MIKLCLTLFLLLTLCLSCDQNNNGDDNFHKNSSESQFSADLIDLFDEGGREIPPEFFATLGIDSVETDENDRFITIEPFREKGKITILGISKAQGCTPVTCTEEMRFYSLRKNMLVDKIGFQFTYESNPEIIYLPERLIAIYTIEHSWKENNAGVMEETNQLPVIRGTFVSIYRGKFRLFDDLETLLKNQSKVELRLLRNSIFAKYGYKFKSEDLAAYFSNFEWYSPRNDYVVPELTVREKELVLKITEIEESRP